MKQKSIIAGKSPKVIKLEGGETYTWCACGRSASQPWCDGSHKGSGFVPKVFEARIPSPFEKDKTSKLCMCKQTNDAPFCDGSHTKL